MKEHRITNTAAVILVVLAIICDIIGLIPFVESFIAVLYWIGAGIYMWLRGMGIFNGKLLASESISLASSIIPAIQALPGITVGIIAVIIISRAEEKTGISVSAIRSGKGIRLPPPKIPLNNNGTRAPRA